MRTQGTFIRKIQTKKHMKARQICVTLAIAAWCFAAFLYLCGESETMGIGGFLLMKAAALAALLLGGYAWHKADKKGLIIKLQ